MKNVLIVDDLPEAAEMLRCAVLGAFGNAETVVANGVGAAGALLEAGRYDLALVDLQLGDGSGIDVIERIARAQPECAVVVSTIHDGDDFLFPALQAGAHGYVLKDQPTQWLASQLRGIADGQPPLSPAIARRLLRHFKGSPAPRPAGASTELSAREREVLGLLAQGTSVADIARELSISRHTVGDHVKSIYRKLNIRSRAEAALHARGLGLA